MADEFAVGRCGQTLIGGMPYGVHRRVFARSRGRSAHHHHASADVSRRFAPRPARLTEKALSCAARALVPKPARRAACLHVSRAMQAARRRDDFDFTSRLGRRAEAGPRRLLGRVSQPVQETRSAQYAGRLLW